MAVSHIIVSFIDNHKRALIEIALVIVFCFIGSLSISKCTYYRDANEKNIISLTDTVKYYRGKLSNIVAIKGIPEADYNNLKMINDSLYKMIKSMKIKGKPDVVVGSDISVDNGKRDTIWYVEEKEDSVVREFDFSNDWRQLTGQVSFIDDSLGMKIDKDVVRFKYALSIKDNQVYMTSDNPYVKFNTITGLKIPENKRVKRFGVGPVIYGGYDFKSNGFGYGVGIGIQYNLFQF